MKLLSIVVVALFSSQAMAGTGGSFERSLSLAGTAAAIPAPSPAIRVDEAKPLWPMLRNTWEWYEPSDALTFGQLEALLPQFSGAEMIHTITKKTSVLVSISIKKKSGMPAGLSFVGDNHTYQSSVEEMSSFFDVFKLSYVPRDNQANEHLVAFEKDGVLFHFYFDTQEKAKRFMDMMVSLCKLAGLPSPGKYRHSFRLSNLSQSQAEVLGMDRVENALVTDIAEGGPAKVIGLKYLDVITEADGVKVRSASHLLGILDDAAPGSVLKLSCLERVKKTDGETVSYSWKPKTVTLTVR